MTNANPPRENNQGTRLVISEYEISRLPDEFRIRNIPDNYFVKLMRHANRLGLEGKEIDEIFCIDDHMNTMRVFDFSVKSPDLLK